MCYHLLWGPAWSQVLKMALEGVVVGRGAEPDTGGRVSRGYWGRKQCVCASVLGGAGQFLKGTHCPS